MPRMSGASVSETQPSPVRWWILIAVLLGTLLGTINNSIGNVALPSILDEFDRNVGSGVWVITGYVLSFSTFMPVFGRLADMFGRRRIYLGCLLGYAVMGLFCTFAPSVEALIASRALQGIAIAPVLPVVMSIVATTFPREERGRAMGLWAAVNGLGLAIGAPLGGFLTNSLGWRSIFWATIPIALIAYFAALKVVPADTEKSQDRFDGVGAGALIAMMVCVMSSPTLAGELGMTSPVTLGLLAAAVFLFVIFILTETTTMPPFVDLSLFGLRAYVAATAVAALQLFCLGGTLLLIPLFVVRLQGNDTAFAGALLFFLPATMMAVATVAGRANDRFGSRLPIVGGLLLIAIAGAGLGWMQPTTSSAYLIACLVVMGTGIAFVQSPAAAAVTYVVEPERIGVAVGFFNMFRFVGSAFATTIFGVTLQAITEYGERAGAKSHQEALAVAFQVNFLALAAVAVIALVIATQIVGRPRDAERSAVSSQPPNALAQRDANHTALQIGHNGRGGPNA
ncbi:MAG: MFS transporter [Chloroflexota bacterium]